MAFLSEQDQQFLREKFAEALEEPVKLLLFTKRAAALFVPGAPDMDAQYLQQVQELLEEVASLSDKVSVEVYDYISDIATVRAYGVDKIPAIFVQANGTTVRYFGMPAGYEFSTFIQDIFDLSVGGIELEEETQKYLRDLDQDVHIQVFVTPT